MKSRTVVSLLFAFTLLFLFALLPGCGSKDSNPAPTAPVAEPFESGDLLTGTTFVRTFANAGSFSYRCRFHNGMSGTVTVATGGADSARIEITSNAFGAPVAGSLPIKPGGYVRWLNLHITHSVTRP
jgi:plastocyanin